MVDRRPCERCVDCDEPTGRAGIADDSIYCNCGEGPFCVECWQVHKLICIEAEDE